MGTKLRWTNEERLKMIEQFSKIYNPSYPVLETVRDAQREVLPLERRRVLRSVQEVKWLIDAAKSKKTLPPVIKPPVETKPDLKELITELLTGIIKDIVKEVITNVKHELKVDNKNYGEYDPEEKGHLRRVAVYGLLPQQEQSILSDFDGCFDFRFIKDVSQKRLIQTAAWADKFIIVTKFVSHDYDAIRKLPNIQFITGASSNLKTVLENYYVES